MKYNNVYSNVSVGDSLKFKEDDFEYVVKAKLDGFMICVRFCDLENTVLYTIVDFNEGMRGPDDYIFGLYDYSCQSDINIAIQSLSRTRIAKLLGGLIIDDPVCLSPKRSIKLEIDNFIKNKENLEVEKIINSLK